MARREEAAAILPPNSTRLGVNCHSVLTYARLKALACEWFGMYNQGCLCAKQDYVAGST